MLVFIVCGYLHRCNRKFTKLFNCWLVVFVLMLLILLVLSLSARQDQTCLWLGRAEYDISVFKQFAAVLTLLFCSLSWCNYFFSWCNCCFAYFVAELVMRANQAVCLAILHWFSLVTKAAAGIFEVNAMGNQIDYHPVYLQPSCCITFLPVKDLESRCFLEFPVLTLCPGY